jgi:hypothetical protein
VDPNRIGMKLLPSLLATLVAWSVASSLPLHADPKESINTGDSVAAMWSDGNYYIGTVKSGKGESFHILFEDGDKLTVNAAKIFVIHADNELHVGDHVMAVWKEARMFPGVVLAVGHETCLVKWDDGETPMEVGKWRMVRWPK